MTNDNTTRLQSIRDWCQNFLDNVASRRTPGKWTDKGSDGRTWGQNSVEAEDYYICSVDFCAAQTANATFIASCAGPVEAACHSTIVAIDALLSASEVRSLTFGGQQTADEILTAWEGVIP